MNILEPITCAVGEASAYLVGRLVRRTFDIEDGRAQRIGEGVIAAIVLGAAVMATFVFS